MKQKPLILIILLFLYNCQTKNERNEKTVDNDQCGLEINDFFSDPDYIDFRLYHDQVSPYLDYFFNHSEFPESSSILMNDYINSFNENELKKIKMVYFSDPFSKRVCRDLQYYPLYNPTTYRREAFVLLSTGVDGVIDNTLNKTDTLFTNDFLTKLSLYNKKHIYAYHQKIPQGFSYSKPLKNYDEHIQYTQPFSFNKDYLFVWVDFIEYYKAQVTHLEDIESLHVYANREISRIVLYYQLPSSAIKHVDNQTNSCMIDSFTIINKFYNLQQTFNLTADTMYYIGTYSYQKKTQDTIVLENVIQVKPATMNKLLSRYKIQK